MPCSASSLKSESRTMLCSSAVNKLSRLSAIYTFILIVRFVCFVED